MNSLSQLDLIDIQKTHHPTVTEWIMDDNNPFSRHLKGFKAYKA